MFRISCLILLMMGLFFTSYAQGAEEATADEINSAYEYFSNSSSMPSKDTIQLPSKRAAPVTPSNTTGSLAIGAVANNLLQPVEMLSGFFSGASVIIGMSCLFGAFVRYRQYRTNPLASPISTVITLLVLGILLLLLPLVYKLTVSGIPFTLG